MKQSKQRRPANVLVSDLKSKRERLVAKHDSRIARLDATIAKVEDRYRKSIAIAELLECSKTELSAELDKAKSAAKLLRLALKKKRAG